MSKFPYTCLLILLLCTLVISLVMWFVYRWRLRKVARAIHIRSNERLVQRIRIARELYDTLLQTVEACKFVIDDTLESANDTAQMRLALEKLSSWLGQATQEGQKVLNSLFTANLEKHDH